MRKSEYAHSLDLIQIGLAAYLLGNGFRKRGRTYNRQVSDGIVQVINFQMGRSLMGGKEIPDLRHNLSGRFTVNLGVFLPCVHELEFRRKPKPFYLEYDCHIRTRIGSLMGDSSDLWWGLDQDVKFLTTTMEDLIGKFGFPFLAEFPDYEAVKTYYKEHDELPSNIPGRSALIIGIIYHGLGDGHEAVKHFEKALDLVRKQSGHPGFEKHIQDIRDRCLMPPDWM